MYDALRARIWNFARGGLPLDVPRVMGIVNVTPDSFYSGARHAALDAALIHADKLITEGADILDIGGESTRPGARPVDVHDELERVVPLIRAIVQRWPDVAISIDTVKAEVADAALNEGAVIINDVSAFRLDPRMPEVCARHNAGVVLMHSRGTVQDMASYAQADYGDVTGDVATGLAAAAEQALAAGSATSHIVLDPGLGFAKRTEHSIALLAHLDRITALGYPVLVGPSRKRFVGELSGATTPEERLEGTIGACVSALWQGARIFRVHDVLPVRRALLMADAILREAK